MYKLRRSSTHRPRRRSGGPAELAREGAANAHLGPPGQRSDRPVDRETDHGRKGRVDAAEHEADHLEVRLEVDSAAARWLRSGRQQEASTKS